MPDLTAQKSTRLARIQSRLVTIEAERDRLHAERARLTCALPLPAPCGAPPSRLTWEEADARAREIHALRLQGMLQREIAARLRIKRYMVAYYLSDDCKARARCGLS